MANSDNSSMHEGTHRTRRSVGRVGAVAIALVLGGTASFVTAFAHHIVSTTPTPTVGVVGTTPLADTALVYADNTRTVVFFLWAPGTCGSPNATPVMTDSEPVTTPTPHRQHRDVRDVRAQGRRHCISGPRRSPSTRMAASRTVPPHAAMSR